VEDAGVKQHVTRWLPLAAWLAVIFGLSSIPDLPGEAAAFPEGTDKVAHFCEYAILAYILHRGLCYGRARSGWVSVAVIGFAGTAVGVLDELYQGTVGGRVSSVTDLLADIAGIAAGAAAAVYLQRRRYSKDRR
jgi:VanZ family protein